MSLTLIVPDAISAALQEFESSSGPSSELEVWQALSNARKSLVEPTEPENLGAWAELLAFALVARRSEPSPWNTYFCPMGSRVKDDGTPFYSPDIEGTPAEVVDYWAARARATVQPVMKARYADLVWDMGHIISGKARNPDFAIMAIDAYLAAITDKRLQDLHAGSAAALRALDLAIMLRDDARTQLSRRALLDLHKAAVAERKLWWSTYDRLEAEKRAGFTDEERRSLIDDLETLLSEYCDATAPDKFDPHATQEIAIRLVRHYTRLKRFDDVKRLHRAVASAFEHVANIANALAASTFLQTAVNAYRDAGMPDDSKRARRLMQQKIAQSREEMTPIFIKSEVKKEDLEAFVASVVVEDLGQTFVNIAASFLPRKQEMERFVEEVAKEAPISAHISSMILGSDHVAGKIGPVDEDACGRLVQQTAQSLAFNNLFLWTALERTLEVHHRDPEHFVAWANRLDLFEDVTFLLEGVRAWMHGDLVKAVHVLVPQIEHGLRMIVDDLGEPVTKAHRVLDGVGVSIGMGDILNGNARVAEALGPDMTLYFLALYADARGRNLRNRVAHGLLAPGEVTSSLVHWLIHTLLVLGIWDKLAEHRR